MRANALVSVTGQVEGKDERVTIDMPPKTDMIPTEILLGDGNAEVERSMSMRIAGGDYNAVVLTTSASIKIKCNQDDETIEKALGTCEKIAIKAVKDYQPSMEKTLRKLVAGRS